MSISVKHETAYAVIKTIEGHEIISGVFKTKDIAEIHVEHLRGLDVSFEDYHIEEVPFFFKEQKNQSVIT